MAQQQIRTASVASRKASSGASANQLGMLTTAPDDEFTQKWPGELGEQGTQSVVTSPGESQGESTRVMGARVVVGYTLGSLRWDGTFHITFILHVGESECWVLDNWCTSASENTEAKSGPGRVRRSTV